MKITPVKGTNDYLPKEARLRDYLQAAILETYQACGFERIMTPALEDIENLNKSEGGENLNLLFKILKRGDKFEKAVQQQDYENLSDIGLRYDLTLPLSRYYANNKNKLMLPLKCIQIDKVYRAERPQKGRLREFVQCDIDIIGSDSCYCEVELISTTATALMKLGINNFKIKINDRRLLKDILVQLGFVESQLDTVCISLDKLDKIGTEGIEKELMDKNFIGEKINKLVELVSRESLTIETVKSLCKDTQVIDNLNTIIEQINVISKGDYGIELDITLVRGQGYYTGTIFEIESPEFKGAIAGGGRYDHLIGKFLNESIPAVGFSIGFERIFSILSESDYKIPTRRKRVALLYDVADFKVAFEKAEQLRSECDVALFEKTKKTGKLINKLAEQGFDGFYSIGQSEQIQELN
jgi:histidyl-tRNA synthetase